MKTLRQYGRKCRYCHRTANGPIVGEKEGQSYVWREEEFRRQTARAATGAAATREIIGVGTGLCKGGANETGCAQTAADTGGVITVSA